jgi:hypothetical protein
MIWCCEQCALVHDARMEIQFKQSLSSQQIYRVRLNTLYCAPQLPHPIEIFVGDVHTQARQVGIRTVENIRID